MIVNTVIRLNVATGVHEHKLFIDSYSYFFFLVSKSKNKSKCRCTQLLARVALEGRVAKKNCCNRPANAAPVKSAVQ